ncbi:MAG: hypothetical protein ACRC62_32770 [Microcoleus sp.]
MSPDDFNPFTPEENRVGHSDWDAIAVEILREYYKQLPQWVFTILDHCGVKPFDKAPKLGRSLSRIYGCMWAVGVDPFQVGGVWYWSLLFFKDEDTDNMPDVVCMQSWNSDSFVEVPGAFLRHWIEEGGTIYFGDVEV